jgi:hypothetical protein
MYSIACMFIDTSHLLKLRYKYMHPWPCVVANILKISIRYLAGGKFCQGNCLGYKKSLNIPKGQSESVYVEEKQTTQWPKDRKTDNTMATRQKNRQHNGQKKK